MILNRNSVIQTNSLRKFLVLHICSQTQKVLQVFLPFFAIWVSFQVFCPALVPWIFKNTKGDLSTTHSPWLQRRKPLSTDNSSAHSQIMTSPESMGVKKCRGHLNLLGGLGDFHSSLLYWNLIYLRPSSFIGRVLPSSRLR